MILVTFEEYRKIDRRQIKIFEFQANGKGQKRFSRLHPQIEMILLD